MKYLKTHRLFESYETKKQVEVLKDIFADLQDEGFRITVEENIPYRKINFPPSNKISCHEIDHFVGKSVKVTEVSINRMPEYIRSKIPLPPCFKISDIIDTLIQAESYLKNELNSKIECIYVVDVPKYEYYKGVSDLPKDQKVDRIVIGFSTNQTK